MNKIEHKIDIAKANISKATAEIIDIQVIEKLLRRYYEYGENYSVKAGFDPTAPDIHLGHTVLLQKLRTFQEFGGIVQFVVGDFTATIGDPTGKTSTRKALNQEQVSNNIQSYTTQAFKILDKNKTEVYYNNNWLGKLNLSQIIGLTSHLTISRMLERDDFSKRFKASKPIATSEFMYPLLQGYDSVYLKSDIEIGGTDQKFNLLMGRQLQKIYGLKKQQAVLMMPILEGLDGVDKMSKSLGNYIGVDDKPFDMFGKILSISDNLMWRYFELLSSKTADETKQIKEKLHNKQAHPKDIKVSLAIELVERFHDKGEAKQAKAQFDKVFAKKLIPDEINKFSFDENKGILDILVQTNMVASTSQARRDINAGAVKMIQDEKTTKITDEKLRLKKGIFVLQKGKKNFAQVEIKGQIDENR
ncbi:MAG: tyrosine--tRNA ligase [Epsilonproteobacteria bacterium]|nr:MAG: tyrosine--tRNA ligase [Campylobacterota bacterium]